MMKELRFVDKVAEEVERIGGKVYFVGGYVRDKLLNKQNKDIDVEVYGLTLEELESVLSKHGTVMQVGASFGILMVKGYDVDFALPRTESKTGSKHTDFEVVVNGQLSLKEASKRRDFTMNAVMQDVRTGQYIDYYGGIKDIQSGIIRFVDNETFVEDELRAFRACQFASRFNFTIDPSVIDVSKGFSFNLSKERIFEELNKALLKSEKPSIAFNYLYDMGIVDKLFPELASLKGCGQSKQSHPEGDVWNHTMLVLDNAANLKSQSKNPLYFMYTALCHDMGKPDAKRVSDTGKITFYYHEEIGVPIAEKFLRRFTLEGNLIKYVLLYTRHHMLGHKIGEIKDSTLRKLMVNVDMEELILFSEADDKGKGLESIDYSPVREAHMSRVQKLSVGSFGKIEPYFTGADLISMGYSQGKELGDALEEAYTSQLNGQNKENILSMLKNRISPDKKKVSLGELIDSKVEEVLQKDSVAIQKATKRVVWFRELEKQGYVKYKRTPNKVPYLLVIAKDRKYKFVLTPFMALGMRLDNTDVKVLFDTKNNTVLERKRGFKQVLSRYEGREQMLMPFHKVYGRLGSNSSD